MAATHTVQPYSCYFNYCPMLLKSTFTEQQRCEVGFFDGRWKRRMMRMFCPINVWGWEAKETMCRGLCEKEEKNEMDKPRPIHPPHKAEGSAQPATANGKTRCWHLSKPEWSLVQELKKNPGTVNAMPALPYGPPKI